MNLNFIDKETFYVCGYCVETCPKTNNADIAKLLTDFEAKKEELLKKVGQATGFYGLIWYTENHHYCYLYGVEANEKSKVPEGACIKCIPKAHYAIYNVPDNMSAVEAWTDYFDNALPESGYAPDTDHGMYFEFYPKSNLSGCQLWTPVKKVCYYV